MNDKLYIYINAYIDYELNTGFKVDPRITIENTHMSREERYKERFYLNQKSIFDDGKPYLPKILASFRDKDCNLVHPQQQIRFTNRVNELGEQVIEEMLVALYEGDDDKNTFEDINEFCQHRFDLVAYLFFLKDKNRYLPLRSARFDDNFKLLDIELNLAGHCSWETYISFIDTIRKIQERLCELVTYDFSLLDAHSFVWMLDKIDNYLEENDVPESKYGSTKKTVTNTRVGQSAFRERVKEVWGEKCSVTESTILFSAAHIKPWSESDEKEKVDKFNGFLFVPNIHELFDSGLITFDDDGKIIMSSLLDINDAKRLGISCDMKLRKVFKEQLKYLKYHREKIFKE